MKLLHRVAVGMAVAVAGGAAAVALAGPALAGETTVCGVSGVPAGWVVTRAQASAQCGGGNQLTITDEFAEDMSVCAPPGSVPAGWVATQGAFMRPDCAGGNRYTVRSAVTDQMSICAVTDIPAGWVATSGNLNWAACANTTRFTIGVPRDEMNICATGVPTGFVVTHIRTFQDSCAAMKVYTIKNQLSDEMLICQLPGDTTVVPAGFSVTAVHSQDPRCDLADMYTIRRA